MSASSTIDLGIPGITDACEIGHGGYASVYRARERLTRREVAVKVLHAGLETDRMRASFEGEAAALGRLSEHPNVVSLYRADITDDGRPFLVMPYLSAGSLHQLLRTHGPMPTPRMIEMVTAVLAGLDAAHSAGILHCDIKPANVMVADDGTPQLMDFGVCRFTSPALQEATVIGTPAYSAPETLAGDPPTVASDLYAIGALMYALLTTSPPFITAGRTDLRAVVGEILTVDAPRLHDLAPAPVADLIADLLAKQPSHRPASIAELTSRLAVAAAASVAPTAAVAAAAPAPSVEYGLQSAAPETTTSSPGPGPVDAWWRRAAASEAPTPVAGRPDWWNPRV